MLMLCTDRGLLWSDLRLFYYLLCQQFNFQEEMTEPPLSRETYLLFFEIEWTQSQQMQNNPECTELIAFGKSCGFVLSNEFSLSSCLYAVCVCLSFHSKVRSSMWFQSWFLYQLRGLISLKYIWWFIGIKYKLSFTRPLLIIGLILSWTCL